MTMNEPRWIDNFSPEDSEFWRRTGKKISRRSLVARAPSFASAEA